MTGGRIIREPDGAETPVRGYGMTDEDAREAGMAWKLARILGPHFDHVSPAPSGRVHVGHDGRWFTIDVKEGL